MLWKSFWDTTYFTCELSSIRCNLLNFSTIPIQSCIRARFVRFISYTEIDYNNRLANRAKIHQRNQDWGKKNSWKKQLWKIEVQHKEKQILKKIWMKIACYIVIVVSNGKEIQWLLHRRKKTNNTNRTKIRAENMNRSHLGNAWIHIRVPSLATNSLCSYHFRCMHAV